MLELLTAFLSGFLGPLVRDLVADWRRDRALQAKGAADAALETSHTIRERADAQRENDARDRGGTDAVARRLRERLESGG